MLCSPLPLLRSLRAQQHPQEVSGKPKGKAAEQIAGGIILSEAIEAKGEAMFRHACQMGLEGIVSKRLGSPYVSARTRHRLTIKNPGFGR